MIDQILLEDANGGTGGDAILSGLRLQLHTWNGSSMEIKVLAKTWKIVCIP